jgi:regulator of replication initiation timing
MEVSKFVKVTDELKDEVFALNTENEALKYFLQDQVPVKHEPKKVNPEMVSYKQARALRR